VKDQGTRPRLDVDPSLRPDGAVEVDGEGGEAETGVLVDFALILSPLLQLGRRRG
jgi:hypothetical protein